MATTPPSGKWGFPPGIFPGGPPQLFYPTGGGPPLTPGQYGQITGYTPQPNPIPQQPLGPYPVTTADPFGTLGPPKDVGGPSNILNTIGSYSSLPSPAPSPTGLSGGPTQRFPTTNQPGVPSLGSTTIIPGSSPSQPSPPDYINLLNQLNLQGQQNALGARIPGGPALEAQSSGNIAQELAGVLPQDVLDLIQQQGAERGVMTGSPGSPNAEAATLAALGLTSLGLQQQGQQDLTAALGRNPAAPLVNLTGMLLTPYEAGELNVRGQQNLSQLGGLNPPAPYTGPGSGEGYLQAMPGGSATPANWWQDIVGSQSPYGQPSTAPGQMSDQEYQTWQDYVMGGGQAPVPTDTGQISDAEYQNWWNSILGGYNVDPGFTG